MWLPVSAADLVGCCQVCLAWLAVLLSGESFFDVVIMADCLRVCIQEASS
jgi:hypothetical protein